MVTERCLRLNVVFQVIQYVMTNFLFWAVSSPLMRRANERQTTQPVRSSSCSTLPNRAHSPCRTVVDCVSQRAQLGGCAHEVEHGSPSLHCVGGRLAEIVIPGLDFANEVSGVRQVRDRLLFCERARDQLQRLDAGVPGALCSSPCINWPQPAKKERTCFQNSRSGTTEENRLKTASEIVNPPQNPNHIVIKEEKE
jgi:hypothetical protein